jgi:hypothetical protein
VVVHRFPAERPDPARSPDLARALVLGAGTPEDERAWALSAPLVRDRSVLVPAAHDEPMLRFGLTRGVCVRRWRAPLAPVRRALDAGGGGRTHLIFETPKTGRSADPRHGGR